MKPGIYYDISNEEYHSGDGISKSQLDYIAECPALFLWSKKAPRDENKTKYLEVGTAFHCLLLEPEKFNERYIIAPEFNRRTNEGKAKEKEFLASIENEGKFVIDTQLRDKLMMMRDSVLAHSLGNWAINTEGKCESSIYWNDHNNNVLCRCRPDKLITDYEFIIDVKTTSDIKRFDKHAYDLRYHVQDSFYSDGVKSILGFKPRFIFLIISTTMECGRYPVKTFEFDDLAKDIGRMTYKKNLYTLLQCQRDNDFPALQNLTLPAWAKELKNDFANTTDFTN